MGRKNRLWWLKYGAEIGIDKCYLTIKCSWVWVRLDIKDSLTQNGDNSLEGLDIDWHLAEFDYPATPISRKADVQSSHVYA